ncbi:flagellar assembly protein FliW [Salinibacterium sp. SYSU T00001]|uniref:flagellar assembly protein FliW n=1 Tax=Homoserinimonas sedimenticola TaxID=2986805 RepID=UPI002236B5CE|nr:flagellar assembly protein FliW [Salinibacterium sedimenticola]MCW4385747.1 flagellar assembly protein FliW [Salinibacterium sedimenticola]
MTAALTFVVPPPGFAPHVDFVLDPVAGAIGLFTLRAIAEGSPRLYVLDAGVYLPAYTPELSDQQVASLGLTSPDDALVLVVANPGTDGTTTTNLMAPIVVNSTTGACAQFILDNQDWPLRAELARA